MMSISTSLRRYVVHALHSTRYYILTKLVLQTIVIAAVMAADFFNGLNTHVWTWWVFFAVALGIVLVWGYTVSTLFPIDSASS